MLKCVLNGVVLPGEGARAARAPKTTAHLLNETFTYGVAQLGQRPQKKQPCLCGMPGTNADSSALVMTSHPASRPIRVKGGSAARLDP